MATLSKNATALDQLERENRELRGIFVELDAHRSASVEDRAEYGKLLGDRVGTSAPPSCPGS